MSFDNDNLDSNYDLYYISGSEFENLEIIDIKKWAKGHRAYYIK